MEVWHWMYDHPDASAKDLREAVLNISKDIWNKYYAPAFEKKDVVLLGIYSHMIHSFLYLPDYPMGHMIAFQIEEQIRKSGNVGSEVERMAKQGIILPDMWMKNATGSVVSPDALLEATEHALKEAL
jgi:oligoendopeptidase F